VPAARRAALTKAASLVESAARVIIGRGFINYPFLAHHDPFLTSIRADARFDSLMVALRPRWEAIVEWERPLA